MTLRSISDLMFVSTTKLSLGRGAVSITPHDGMTWVYVGFYYE